MHYASLKGEYYETLEKYGTVAKPGTSDYNSDEHDDLIDLLGDLHNYIYAAYFLGINPLMGLCRLLPQYRWEYHQWPNTECNVRAASKIVLRSDFIWITGDPHDTERIELVTATKVGRSKSFSLFFVNSRLIDTQFKRLMVFVRLCGGNAEHY